VVTVLAIAISCGACVSIHVNDLQFVRLREVSQDGGATLPNDVRRLNRSYPDSEFVEATLSTSRDLVELVGRDDAWMPVARFWRCDNDRMNGAVIGAIAFYYRQKAVRPAILRALDDVAHPSDVSDPAPYSYTVYFLIRDEWRPTWPEKLAYDLARTPVDVCIDFVAKAFLGSISFETNVVTIPATAFEALFAGHGTR
jgi:hypothetical protein